MDSLLSPLPTLPEFDGYAFNPACARLHIYRSPSSSSVSSSATDSNGNGNGNGNGAGIRDCNEPQFKWAIITQLLGWSTQDQGWDPQNINELRVYTMGSAIRQDRDKSPSYVDYMKCDVILDLAQLLLPTASKLVGDNEVKTNDVDSSEKNEQWRSGPYLWEKVKEVKIRNQVYSLSRDPEWYTQRGVTLENVRDSIGKEEVIRALVHDHKNELLLTKAEIEERYLDPECKVVEMAVLEDWYHCDGFKDQMSEVEGEDEQFRQDHVPKNNVTFRALAQCLLNGSMKHYEELTESKTLPDPNTHWDNWPEAGFYK